MLVKVLPRKTQGMQSATARTRIIGHGNPMQVLNQRSLFVFSGNYSLTTPFVNPSHTIRSTVAGRHHTRRK